MKGKQGKWTAIFVKVCFGILAVINLIFILLGEWALLLVTPLAFVFTFPLWNVTAKDYAFLLWWNQK